MIDFLQSIVKKIYKQPEVLQNHLQERAEQKCMVFTNGCFDILHRGHIEYLAQARSLGDFLIVGLNSNASVQKNKGRHRPINDWPERALLLAALQCTDYIVAMEDSNPIRLIRLLKPNIHCKGGDYRSQKLPESVTVHEVGGVVKIIDFVDSFSTTNLIQRIQRK